MNFGLVHLPAILEFEGPGCDTIEPVFCVLGAPDADGMCKPRVAPRWRGRERVTLKAVLVHVAGVDIRVETVPHVLDAHVDITLELVVSLGSYGIMSS